MLEVFCDLGGGDELDIRRANLLRAETRGKRLSVAVSKRTTGHSRICSPKTKLL